MTRSAQYAIALGLVILALVACIPSRHEETALRTLPASSVPSKQRLAAESTTPPSQPPHTTAPRASRSASQKPRVAPRPRSAPQGTASGDLLDRLAMCESGMNPRANTGNGFYGAFQWMLSTWHGMGMSGNPIDYSYAEQKAVAARIPVSAWPRQFPGCSRKLGIR